MPFRSNKGTKIEFLGDSGPFSRLGTSICYKITYSGAEYLIDCGAAVFSTVGPEVVKRLRAIFGTHSHEDHRRWFVDMALYRYYFSNPSTPLRLVGTETILEEYLKTSRGGLERTLSQDSREVIEVPFTNYVEPIVFGPTARYRILRWRLPGEEGSVWRVIDENGEVVPPQQAKTVVHPEANRPRLIFRDFDTGRWVEPESFYPFSEKRFYSDDDHPYHEADIGITFEPMKATAWHGPSTVAIRIQTEDERILFSSDTVYDPALWKELATTIKEQKLDMTRDDFESAYVIYGEINNYIEQSWSVARYERAMSLYEGHVLFHDVAGPGAVVHTNYAIIAASGHERLFLTHSPDHFASEIPLTISDKTLRVIGDECFEEVDGELWEFDADIYYKENGKAYVGYRADDGAYEVFTDQGILNVVPAGSRGKGEPVMRVNLFRDIAGQYFPKLENPAEHYHVGPNGKVYVVTYSPTGGTIRLATNLRGRLRSKPSILLPR